MSKKRLILVKINKIPINLDLHKYIKWINDKEVVEFSEQRLKKHTLISQKKYLKSKISSNSSIIFQINLENNFIGMLELGNINLYHKTCEIMYVIGEKKLWKKNIGTLAVSLGIKYAKNKLKMFKIYAGTYSKNISSKKVLLKNKFRIVGTMKKDFLIDKKNNIRDDNIIFEKIL